MNSRRNKIVVILGIALAFLLFLPLALERVRAINNEAPYQEKVGVMVQVNDGKTYTIDPVVKVEVDIHGNNNVTMFSIVICQEETGLCSELTADHRYNEFNAKKTTVYAKLSWIKDYRPKAVIGAGRYDIKVKPEYKHWLGVKDIIEDDEYENRYIHTSIYYSPLSENDMHIQYNGVNLSAEGQTNITSRTLSFLIGPGASLYGIREAKVNYKYCVASSSWVVSDKCEKGTVTLVNNEASFDLAGRGLEGHYVLEAEFVTNLGTVNKSAKFFYDQSSPRVIVEPSSSEVAKEHTVNLNVIDNSNINVRYVVLPDYVEEVKNMNIFTNSINSTSITVSGLTGNYRVWIYAVDSNDNVTIVRSSVLHFDNTAPKIVSSEYFYDELNKEIIVHIEEVVDQCDTGIKFFASTDKENYIESTYNYLRVPVKEGDNTIYLYAMDRLGNADSNDLYELAVEFPTRTFEISYENQTRDNYYKGPVTFKAPTRAISIKINGAEHVFDPYTCVKGENKYTCKVNMDGVYSVIISDGIISYTSSFIIDNDGFFNIDDEAKEVNSIVLIPIRYENGKYYGKLPLSIYDANKNISLIYRNSNGTYASLSDNTQNIHIANIPNYYKFDLDINVALYQESMYATDLGYHYFLAVVTDNEEFNGDLVVTAPEFPTEYSKESSSESKQVKYKNSIDWRSMITLRNIVIFTIIIVIAFYLIRFFVFKKD